MSLVWSKINTVHLIYGGTFKDNVSSIRAKTFAEMLKLAHGRVQFYTSDLFHDALWLRENVTEPCSFDWITRESGTDIGKMAATTMEREDLRDRDKYRFEIIETDRKFDLNIYQAVPYESVVNVPDTTESFLPETGAMEPPEPVDPLIQILDETESGWKDPTTDARAAATLEKLFPTQENEEPSAPTTKRKVRTTMEEIIDELRNKMNEAQSQIDEAEEKKSELEQYIEGLDGYKGELESLIDSLETMPEFDDSVQVDLSFDSSH